MEADANLSSFLQSLRRDHGERTWRQTILFYFKDQNICTIGKSKFNYTISQMHEIKPLFCKLYYDRTNDIYLSHWNFFSVLNFSIENIYWLWYGLQFIIFSLIINRKHIDNEGKQTMKCKISEVSNISLCMSLKATTMVQRYLKKV